MKVAGEDTFCAPSPGGDAESKGQLALHIDLSLLFGRDRACAGNLSGCAPVVVERSAPPETLFVSIWLLAMNIDTFVLHQTLRCQSLFVF